jgi:type II secretory ATPase GspE/PulE/Tfp pilus assembly ATPase PilB-like protein
VSASQRLGEVLVQRGLVTREQLDGALARQRAGGRRLGELLLAMGVVTQEQLNWALSEALHIPFVELSDETIDLEVARSLPEGLLRRHEAVPILREGGELTVLVADPTNRQAAIELEALTGLRVTIALAAREAVLHFLDRAFPATPRTIGPPSGAANGHAGAVMDLTGVSQAFTLLLDAVRDRVSELYLDPAPSGVFVRVRVDGQLLDRAWFDRELLAPITFRLRLLAGLRGEPGPSVARVRTRLEGRDVELECVFVPTLSGEAVTVRFWPTSAEAPTLRTLGVPPPTQKLLEELAGGQSGGDAPGGVVVVAGVDAGARAATLYALARAAAAPGRRVMTLERRVSFVVPDFLQVELPVNFETEAVLPLVRPADVTVVEDLGTPALAAAAVTGAEQGTLVLAGVALGSARSALSYLSTVDLRGPLLARTRGVVDVQRGVDTLMVDVLPLTPALRRDLIERKDPWTSPSS